MVVRCVVSLLLRYLLCRQHMPNPSVVTNSTVPIMCYEQLLDHAVGGLEGFRWPRLDEGLPAGLCYTSGTTGNPKVGRHAHKQC